MPDYNPKEAEYWESLPGTMGTTQPATKFLKERIERAIEVGSKVVEVKTRRRKRQRKMCMCLLYKSVYVTKHIYKAKQLKIG